MSYTQRIAFEILRSVDSATLAGSYVNLGSPLQFSSYKLKLVNDSSVLVTVSFDGVNDVDVLPPNSYFIYDEDVTVNHEFLSQGTQFKIKGSAGNGLIYLVTQYLVVN